MALNFPPNPIVGQVYKVGTEQWVWNGTAWNIVPTPDSYSPVSIGANPPTMGVLEGDLWWDSTNGRLFIYYKDANSAQWVAATQIPDPIVEVTSTQVVDAFLDSLTPYVNANAAIAAGVPNGGLYKITGSTTITGIRALIASGGDGVFDDLTVSNSFTFDGTLITATGVEINYLDGVTSLIQPQIDSLVSLSGVAAGSTNLGTFTGTTIAADSTIKQALQALESAIETDAGEAALVALSGMPAGSTTFGTFPGSIIPDNATMQSALSALDVQAGLEDTKTDNLVALSGVAANSTNLGAFNGSIIPDNQNNKQALQALETSIAGKASTTTTDALIALTGVPADSTNLGPFNGTLINDTATIKGALQVLETALEAAPHTVQGNPTEIQFNQAGQFAASSNLTFNTGTNILFVEGTCQVDGSVGEDTVFKASLSDVGYFTVTANGTLTTSGESTFKQRVTIQRGSSEAIVLRTSNDNGTTFPATISAGGSITMPGTAILSGLTYPTTDGTAGQVITTDGNGALTFTTVSGGAGNPAGANGELQFNNGGAFGASNQLTWNSGTNTLGAPTMTAASVLTGILEVSGNTTLGNASTDTITFTGEIDSHYIPTTNAAYDLGDAEHKIRHLFLSDNSLKIGSSSDATIYVEVGANDSSTNLTVSKGIEVVGNILPTVTNTANLGSGSLKWNNGYFNLLHAGNYVFPTTIGTNGKVLGVDAGSLAFIDAGTGATQSTGTFTATLTNAGGTDPSVAQTTTGNYIKLGDQVTVFIAYHNMAATGASGDVVVSGLPFNIKNLSSGSGGEFCNPVGSVWYDKTGLFNTTSPISCFGVENTSTVKFVAQGVQGFVDYDASPGTGIRFEFQLTYVTDD